MEWIKETSARHTVKGRMIEIASDSTPWMFVPEERIEKYKEEFAYFLTLMWVHERSARESTMPEEEKLDLFPTLKWGIVDKTKQKFVWIPCKQMETELSLHIRPERIKMLFIHAEAGEIIEIHPDSNLDKGEVYVKSTGIQ